MRFHSRQSLESAAAKGAKAIPWGEHRMLCRVLDSFYLFVDTRDISLAPHLAMFGHWEAWVTHALSQQLGHTSPKTVLNVGANFGYFTMLLAQKAEKVVAVEPRAVCCELIEHSSHINGLNQKIVPVRGALVPSPCAQTVSMRMYEHLWGGSSVSDGPLQDHLGSCSYVEVDVPSITAEDLAKHGPYDLVFMDIEGAEPDALRELERHDGLLAPGAQVWVEWGRARWSDEQALAFAKDLAKYGQLGIVRETGHIEVVESPEELCALDVSDVETVVANVHVPMPSWMAEMQVEFR